MMLKKTFIFIFGVLALFSCERKQPQLPSNKIEIKDEVSKDMLKLNTLMVEVEQRDIASYRDTSSLTFEETPGGFFYAVTKQGAGDKINKNNIVQVEYQVETLQGDTIYTFAGKTAKELKVGTQAKERGFDHALSLLHAGSSAIVIVPSNLAYGVLGDRDQIPPRATLIYRIHNIKFK